MAAEFDVEFKIEDENIDMSWQELANIKELKKVTQDGLDQLNEVIASIPPDYIKTVQRIEENNDWLKSDNVLNVAKMSVGTNVFTSSAATTVEIVDNGFSIVANSDKYGCAYMDLKDAGVPLGNTDYWTLSVGEIEYSGTAIPEVALGEYRTTSKTWYIFDKKQYVPGEQLVFTFTRQGKPSPQYPNKDIKLIFFTFDNNNLTVSGNVAYKNIMIVPGTEAKSFALQNKSNLELTREIESVSSDVNALNESVNNLDNRVTTIEGYDFEGMSKDVNSLNSQYELGYLGRNMMDIRRWENGGFNTSGIDVEMNSAIRMGGRLEIEPSTEYTFDAEVDKASQVYVVQLKADGTAKSQSQWQSLPYTFTTTNESKYVRVEIKHNDNSTVRIENLSRVLFVKGNDATYTEYSKSNVALTEIVDDNKDWLKSINLISFEVPKYIYDYYKNGMKNLDCS